MRNSLLDAAQVERAHGDYGGGRSRRRSAPEQKMSDRRHRRTSAPETQSTKRSNSHRRSSREKNEAQRGSRCERPDDQHADPEPTALCTAIALKVGAADGVGVSWERTVMTAAITMLGLAGQLEVSNTPAQVVAFSVHTKQEFQLHNEAKSHFVLQEIRH